VEAHGRPVVVISTDGLDPPSPSDEMLRNPRLVEALRLQRQNLSEMRDEVKRMGGASLDEVDARREIDEAIETYLGADLQAFALWDGDWKNIHVRQATGEEAEIWKSSLLRAIEAGEQEPDETS
jgi:hypothetical protein